jgi:primosomal protein N' (replication factor Y)
LDFNLFTEDIADEQVTLFADVLLPVPIPGLFTYRVPAEWNDVIKPGSRAIVQFGKSRILTAVIARIHQTPPQKYNAKYLLELLDEYPSVTQKQLQMFNWVADYYLCCAGEVMNASLPSGLKITSKSHLQLNPEFDREEAITEKEKVLYEVIKVKGSLPYEDAEKITGQTAIHRIMKSLIQKKAILIFEEVKEKYKPKIQKRIRLNPVYAQSAKLEELFTLLEKSEKQTDILLKYLIHIPINQLYDRNSQGIEKSLITKSDASDASLKTLVKNGIFEEFDIIVSRFEDFNLPEDEKINLSEAQTQARNEILSQFEQKQVVLLHGVTGSGKTAVYMDLIQQVLASGSQVLYLLPEIALTTQIVGRLKKTFGDRMGIYHSKFSDNERVEVWRDVLQGKYSFVIGVRSAVMLPFDSLGLIIVDEEHETTYKQFDPAPRYNARDVAIVLAQLHGAKVLLGSATPSVESYTHALAGKYGLVKLMQRFGEAQLPEIQLVDLKTERKQRKMKNAFSSVLLEELTLNLQNKQQSILFQNRRGYAPYITCEECAHIPKCPNCDVSLTYHQYSQEIRCHYCGHHESSPRVCPACQSPKIKPVGVGTEKIEDDLTIFLPEANVQRMDLDTTRKKNAYQNIIAEFETGQTDILVGTQMISKGLDFDKVSLVGIFDADRSINFPDFRSHERTFQLLTQVSGRAGRRSQKGKVIIQTADPEQDLLKKIMAGDYEGFYKYEIEERFKFHYPPFVRMIKIVLKHKTEQLSKKAADAFALKLRQKFGEQMILGPQPPLVSRIRNYYIQEIVVKVSKDSALLKTVKNYIREEMINLETDKNFKQIQVFADVDPM